MKKISLLLCLVLSASLFFISCKEESFGPARLLVANAALTAPVSPSPFPSPGPTIDVRWDGKFIHPSIIYGAASVTTGSPLGSVASPQVVAANYADVKSGAFGLNFAISGQGGADGVPIYNRTTSFLPGRSYTAMSFDFTPLYKTLIMEDDLSAPPAGKIKVRFVHAIPANIFGLIPGSKKDTIDVTAFGGLSANPFNNTSIFSDRTFADSYSNTRLHQFAVLDSGSYRFGIRVARTPGASPATGLLGLFPTPPAAAQRLTEGKIYTIFARLQFPALAPSITIITHN